MRKLIFIMSLIIASCYFARAADVIGFEYWFDGNSASVVFKNSTDNTLSLAILSEIDKSELAEGYHVFHMRIKYMDNSWSNELTDYFVKPSPAQWLDVNNYINQIEYWFDNNSKHITNTSGNPAELNFADVLTIAELNPGIHFFNIRFKDKAGKWSVVQSNHFIISDKPRWEDINNKITDYEYWVDDQLNEKVIGNQLNQLNYTLTSIIDPESLTPGAHFVNVRFKDNQGKWSALQSNYFVQPDEPRWESQNNQITDYEYWIDDNISGKQHLGNINQSSYNLSVMEHVDNLTKGLHFFNTRFKDTEGKWSALHSNYFVIPDLKPFEKSDNRIVECQYWIDDGTKQTKTDFTVNPINFNENISISSLSPGLHFFNCRFKDDAGKWSALNSNYFIKPDIIWQNMNNKINAYTYWFTGSINGIPETKGLVKIVLDVPISPYELSKLFNVPAFDQNSVCTFNIQFRDLEGKWSGVLTTDFTFTNTKPIVSVDGSPFSVNINNPLSITGNVSDPNGDVISNYEWKVVNAPGGSLLNTTWNTKDIMFTPDAGGQYQLSYKAFDGNLWSDPVMVIVNSIDNLPPVVIVQNINVEAGVTGTADVSINNGSYDPDGDPLTIVQSPAGPFGVGTYTVTLLVSDDKGHTSTGTATVTVKDVTVPTVVTKNITVQLDAGGNAIITPEMINNGSTDNCGIASMTLDKSSFSCIDIGEQSVTLAVLDASGNTSTGTALVTVVAPEAPIITGNPSSITTCENQQAIFTVVATGSGLTYQWRRNNVDLIGANDNIYTISSIMAEQAGEYYVVVKDICGQSTTSLFAYLTVNTIPEITSEPISTTVISGSNVTFNVAGTGSPTPTIQWQKSTDNGSSWVNVSEAQSTSLTIPNVTMEQNEDMYHAILTNECGSIPSVDATLQLKLVLSDLGPVEICISTPVDEKGCAPSHKKCGHRIDIKVEFYKNGTTEDHKLFSGELNNQQGNGHPLKAFTTHFSIPLPHMQNIEFAADDYLFCKVFVRRKTNISDFPVRMWFNGSFKTEEGPANRSWSRIHKVTIGGTTEQFYYFRWNEDEFLPLETNAGNDYKYIEVNATDEFKLVDTWRIIGSSMKHTASDDVDGEIGDTDKDNEHNKMQKEFDSFELIQNYPNPFSDGTIIEYKLNAEADVVLNFYDWAGKLIVSDVQGHFIKGTYKYTFNPIDIRSGTYICVLSCNGISKVMNIKYIK